MPKPGKVVPPGTPGYMPLPTPGQPPVFNAPASGGPAAPNISAKEDPILGQIDSAYAKYAEDLQNNTGRILNQATSATRDAFAGLRQQTGEDFALRGVGGGDALRDVDNETGRAIAGQHAQIARNREEQMRGALDARNAARRGAIDATQGEKRIGLDAYSAHNAAMSDYNRLQAQNAATAFDQMMAVMQLQRSGAGASGRGVSSGGGGSYTSSYAPAPKVVGAGSAYAGLFPRPSASAPIRAVGFGRR